MKIKKIRLYWLFLGIANIFFITCHHANLAISDYGIPIVVVLLGGMWSSIVTFKGKKFKKDLIVIAIFIFSVVLGCIISLGRYNAGYVITYLLYGCLILFSLLLPATRSEVNYIIFSYILSSTIFSLFLLINPVNYLGRVSTRFGKGPIFEVNYLSFYISFAIILVVYEIFVYKRRNRIIRGLLIIFLLVNSIANMRTGSRNGIFSIGITLPFFIYGYLKSIGLSKDKILKIVLGIIVVVLSIIYIINNYIPIDIIQRLFSLNIMDESNISRISHWTLGLKTALNSPILGYGVVTSSVAINSILGSYTSSHNTFLSIWINLGILGLGAIVYLFIKLIISTYRTKNIYLIGVICALIFSLMIVEFDISFTFWMMIIIIISLQNSSFEVKY